ncbi:MAG: hypothetical protein MAG431_01117 [Chloroflexi bacterium]|nr:hypothetical protein [Chloroflexota bacterium]
MWPKNFLLKFGGGFFLIATSLAAANLLSDFLTRHALVASIGAGTLGSLTFLGVLLAKRAARVKKANLLARNSLYKDYDATEFEAVTAEIYRQMGYRAKVTGKTGDLGIDVLLAKDGEKIGVQCKHYKKPIGPSLIREFVGALEGARLEKGYFVTTSHFTAGAKKAAKRSTWSIKLIDGITLSQILNRIDDVFERELIPSQRWRELPPLAKIGLLTFLVGDVGVAVGGMVYLLLTA